ncbi:MAG: hypothetical protein GF364_20500 [Candidatus Lokiarchaeota archaeon]|nr:hypothetical protein [Candidatus Lokiarchaeota archaeon]
MMSEDFIFSKNAEILFRVLHRIRIMRGLLNLIFPFYGKVNNYDPNLYRYFAIGQSHLDTAWNWTWPWTKKKIRKTFGNALKHIDEFDKFMFSAPAPAHYEYFERAYPILFEKLKRYVKNNRWDIVGGMWVEPDGNVPDGESLVRQRLYGQKYYIKKFGKYSLVAWVPDSFGFTWSYPQIFLKSGSPYFHTTKLTWNHEHEFPFALFHWEGPDGSRILAHNFQQGFRALERVGLYANKASLIPNKESSPIYNYAFDFGKNDIRGKEYIRDFGWWYGEGDGGGGPLLAELLIPVNLTESKGWKFVKAALYFKLIEKKYGKRLPVWKDELYLEVHRGCQTTLYRAKKQNRMCETLLPKMEKLSICSSIFLPNASICNFIQFPIETFDDCWKKLLFNQFHDILPGSSIEEVYLDADEDYQYVFNAMGILKDSLSEEISKNVEKPKKAESDCLFFFPNHWAGKIVYFDRVINNHVMYMDDENFKDFKDFNYHIVEKPKGIGFQCISEQEAEENTNNYKDIDLKNEEISVQITSSSLKVTINKETANISSLKLTRDDSDFDFSDRKADGLNVLKIYVDEPNSNDAWNLDPNYREKQLNTIEINNINIISPAMHKTDVELAFKIAINESTATLSYIINDALPYIIVKLDLDYQEYRKLLRVEFDTNIKNDKITTGLAYGVIDRPTKPRTPLERGRWEFPGQKFISLSDGSHGLSIMCENRYGFHVDGTQFGMSLKKAPLYGKPDDFMNIPTDCPDNKLREIGAISKDKRKEIKDLGKHRIVWAIYPHRGNWIQAKVYQKFFNFTDHPIKLKKKIKMPKEFDKFQNLIDCSLDHVRISTIKPIFGKKNGLVIRLFEFIGKDDSGTLFIHPDLIGKDNAVKVYNADLLEGDRFLKTEQLNEELKYDSATHEIRFKITRFEIKTIVIRIINNQK